MRLDALTIRGFMRFTDPVTLDVSALPEGLIAVTGPNGCLVGDTLVDVPRDLRQYPHGIPIRDLVGTAPLVYAYSHAEGRIVLARARDVRLTATDRPVFRVRFTSGAHTNGQFLPPQELTGTADHPVMLRDGTFKPLGQLQAGDRLMPLYRRCRDGQYIWINRNDGTFTLEHRMVASFNAGRDMRRDEHGHHLDKNTFNNSEENIECLDGREHVALHGAERPPHYTEHPRGMRGKRHSMDTRRRMSETIRYTLAKPDVRRRHLDGARRAAAARPRRPWHDRETLLRLYVDEGKSTVQIGQALGTSDVVVSYWMEKHGIPRRGMSEAQLARVANHVVVSVESAGVADVYDLEVPGLHNFVANGVVVHNSGKSTLLEAAMAGLYREFASRGALTEYATGKDSYIETAFSVDGRGRYRARVNVDGIRRVTDAVLELTPEDGGIPALVNDGKASTFDQAIRQTFPSRDLMLASAFAAQNQAGNFIHRKPAQRRELFGELLGLAHLTTMGLTAKTIAGHIEQAKGRLVAMRDVIAQQASPEAFAALREGEREARDRQASTQIVRDETGRTIADLEQRLALMQDAVAAHAAASQRLATLRTEQATRQAERRQCETDLQRAQAAYQAETARLHQETTATLTDIDQRLEGNATLQAKAEAIRGAVAAVARIDRELADIRTAHAAAQAREQQALTALHAAERELAALAPLEQRQARDTRDAGLLGTVPCGGDGVYADCQFLRDATTARERLASYVELLEPKAALADAVGRHKAALDAAAADARALAGRIRTAEGERATWADAAKYAEALAASDARVEELKARRAQVLEQAQRDQQAATDRHDAAQGEILARSDALAMTLQGLQAAIEAADADLAAVTDRHQAAAALQVQLTQARATWDGLTASLADIAATLREGMRRANVLTAQRRQADDLTARIATLDTELLEWQLLAKALGKDGLPDLEIDAAGPTISALTNELLEVCHGTRFSLELVTQVAKADGKGMRGEVTIQVTDNANGGTARDIADLSGGEQVVIGEALRSALALYVNQRSMMPLRTCWRDETAGALDPENAQRYLQMLRRAHEIGGYSHTFFIAHNPALADQADAQVRVADGQIAVALPPFAEVA